MSINPGSLVVIDDGDPRILWNGDWVVWRDVGELGVWGPPMLKTMHGFRSSGSLHLQFYGREVSVIGAWTPPTGSVTSSTVNWQCLIDGVVASNRSINLVERFPDRSYQRWVLCNERGLSEENHTIEAAFSRGSEYAWVDTIEYRAPPTANLPGEWLKVSHLGEGIKYTSSWEQDSDRYATWTYINGASLTYNFTGTGLTWGGYIPPGNDSVAAPGLGYYTVDGQQPPTYFAIPTHPRLSRANQAYINITGLEPGSHFLEVVNKGDAGTAALGFSYIYTKSSPVTAVLKKQGRKVIGAAVGASLGAALLIGILAVGLILRRRRRRQRLEREGKVDLEGEIKASRPNTGSDTQNDPIGRTAYPGHNPVRDGKDRHIGSSLSRQAGSQMESEACALSAHQGAQFAKITTVHHEAAITMTAVDRWWPQLNPVARFGALGYIFLLPPPPRREPRAASLLRKRMSVDNSIVTLDDTDPQLQWTGPWFTTVNNVDDPDNLGPPFLNTLHGISGNGNLAFSFHGKIVGVWGSLKPRNTSLGPDPNWQCVLDGQDIGKIAGYPDQAVSNFKLCGAGPLLEGYHTLQLNTLIQSEPLNVDQVQYQAGATADIGDAWTQVDQRDGRFNYSLGWEQDGLLKWTYTPGAWLTFDFVGTGVIWGGYTPDNPGVGSGQAQYLVDHQVTPTNFYIPSRPGSFINQPYFNISGLSPGPHRLQVRNAGNANTAALGLTYVYLKNSPAHTPPPKRNTGKVIGGAVGGTIAAIFLLLLTIGILVWRRRRRNQQQTQESASAVGTSQGNRMSMMSGSTTLKEQLTPGSLTQGVAAVYPNIGAHIPTHPGAPSTGALGPATFPYGSYQPTASKPPSPPGANRLTTFVTPSGPTTSVNPYGSYQPSSGQPPGANQFTNFVTPTRPTTFVTPSQGSRRASFVNSASSSPHLHASTSFPNLPTQPQAQQAVWSTPRQTPVQYVQDGRPDQADDFNPY